MSPRAIAIALIWVGVLVLLGLLAHRFTRGAWSLEDDDVPVISPRQKLLAALALAATTGGLGLFVWSWNGVG
ncbi:hypothetical protein [Paramagnetospirillum magneticum]|uniref:Uncharacterized protein n=1 Tax=Paramagnetospirillum magneticum (strain ATCC 700264 / AMB-1) TaxID=342108 RepID=Q2W511_PARM1|nr:hypothetical protein [Paramagnetospirillum magneticum]BAE51064.1 hypothetical protein amb2260 [Paramagnetospirillum magneticum AMB-1]